ncbi:MAG: hypothetical protein KAU38_10380 [Desulfobacterales bacterium]|nr:hypothetical protein [Desulfobacterales bacterium]
METWKNKASRKYFIYIEDTGHEEALLITPRGEIRSLEKRLFEEAATEDEGTITELQRKRYKEYIDTRKQDAKNRLEHIIAEMSRSELAELERHIDKKIRLRRKYDQEDDNQTQNKQED